MTVTEEAMEAVRDTVSADEAAKALGVSRASIYRWAKSGRIVKVEVGPRSQRFDLRPLLKKIARRKGGGS